MQMNAALYPVDPHAYAALLPRVPEAPWAVPARAALLAEQPGARADDPRQPSIVAVEVATLDGPTTFLFGAADHPGVAKYVGALARPVTLHTDNGIAAQVPSWREGTTPLHHATFTLPAGAGAAFITLPPGGVRRLRPADARHLGTFPAWFWGAYGAPEAMLRAGIAYARYLRAELVSLACIMAETERYDAIGAYTIERTRRNGFATECARRLIDAIVGERGKLPVLTCDTDNAAAVALAASLGLTERHDYTAYRLA